MDASLSATAVEADILAEVEQSATAAFYALSLRQDADPHEVVCAIKTYADEVRPMSGDELEDAAVALGCLWAEQLRTVLDWEWAALEEDGEFRGYGIVSPDWSLITLPMVYLREVLEDPERDNTVLLLFNMLVAGQSPPSARGELRYIS